MTFIPVLLILSLAFAVQPVPNSQLIISDCGDKTYLLHYTNVTATEFKRGKDVVITSEHELLTADVKSGTVHFNVLRNDLSVFSHDFDYCGYQEASLPLALGKIKYTGSDCSKPRPFEDSFSMSVKMPIITPSGRYQFKLDGESPSGQKLFCFYAYTDL